MDQLSITYTALLALLAASGIFLVKRGTGPANGVAAALLLLPVAIGLADNLGTLRAPRIGGQRISVVDAQSGRPLPGILVVTAVRKDLSTIIWRQSEHENASSGKTDRAGALSVLRAWRPINITLFPFYRKRFGGISYAVISPSNSHHPSCGSLPDPSLRVALQPVLGPRDAAASRQQERDCLGAVDSGGMLLQSLKEQEEARVAGEARARQRRQAAARQQNGPSLPDRIKADWSRGIDAASRYLKDRLPGTKARERELIW